MTAALAFDELEQAFEQKHLRMETAMLTRKLSKSSLRAMDEFKKFLKANFRKYFEFEDADQYKKRLGHFASVLKDIARRNKDEKEKDPSNPNPVTHGITKHADWSKKEFKSILGYKQSEGKREEKPGVSLADTQRSITIGPGDKFSNCASLKQTYGCSVEINRQPMSVSCPAECGGGGGHYSPPAPPPAPRRNPPAPPPNPNRGGGGGRYVSPPPPPSNRGRGGGGGGVCTKSWATNDVRNQGACGDCWAFATVTSMRTAYIKEHGNDPGKLSTQYLVDCMPAVQGKRRKDCVNGCCGGLPQLAMQWIQQSGGIPTQAAYGDVFDNRGRRSLLQNRTSLLENGPVSHTGMGITWSGNEPTKAFPCKQGIPKSVTVTGTVSKMTRESDMASYVCNTGTIAIALDAHAWQTYTGGVMRQCSKQLDHAVTLMGMDQQKDSWIVQNSWGEDWGVTLGGVAVPKDGSHQCPDLAKKYGCQAQLQTPHKTIGQVCKLSCGGGGGGSSAPKDGGYIFLQYGSDTCGLTTDAVAPPGVQSTSGGGGGGGGNRRR